ncbi:hypothetical protein V8E54_014737 [Elaphomyces granulatus]
MMDAVDSSFITREEKRCLSVTWDGQLLAGTINDGSKKTHAWEKSPDSIFLFEAPDVANIDEDKKARNSFKRTPESLTRINQLVKSFGNPEGQARHYQKHPPDYDETEEDDTHSEISDQDMYDSIELAVQIRDWVGPIAASLEFWELGPSGPQKRGTRVTVMPKVTGRLPPVRIGDLIPLQYQRPKDLHFPSPTQPHQVY